MIEEKNIWVVSPDNEGWNDMTYDLRSSATENSLQGVLSYPRELMEGEEVADWEDEINQWLSEKFPNGSCESELVDQKEYPSLAFVEGRRYFLFNIQALYNPFTQASDDFDSLAENEEEGT